MNNTCDKVIQRENRYWEPLNDARGTLFEYRLLQLWWVLLTCRVELLIDAIHTQSNVCMYVRKIVCIASVCIFLVTTVVQPACNTSMWLHNSDSEGHGLASKLCSPPHLICPPSLSLPSLPSLHSPPFPSTPPPPSPFFSLHSPKTSTKLRTFTASRNVSLLLDTVEEVYGVGQSTYSWPEDIHIY